MISTMLMLACTSCMAFNAQQKKIVEMIGKVNDYWQSHHKPETRAFWDNAAYHTGNIEAYKLTPNKQWLEYSTKWAEHNKWMGATEKDASKWKYKLYGEDQQHDIPHLCLSALHTLLFGNLVVRMYLNRQLVFCVDKLN